MAELTNREKLLITLLSTVLNPQWSDSPWEIQYNIFRSLQAIYAPGKFSEDEINDLVQAINKVYEEIHSKSNDMISRAKKSNF